MKIDPRLPARPVSGMAGYRNADEMPRAGVPEDESGTVGKAGMGAGNGGGKWRREMGAVRWRALDGGRKPDGPMGKRGCGDSPSLRKSGNYVWVFWSAIGSLRLKRD